MENDNKGLGRGNGWIPKWAICKLCGEQYWRDSARRQYCDECRNVREEERREEQKARSAKWYKENRENILSRLKDDRRRKRAGMLPERKLPNVEEPAGGFEPHVCMVSRRCVYGSLFNPGCNYATQTGNLRTSGGQHKIVMGRCDLFRPRDKKARPGWLADKDKKIERE